MRYLTPALGLACLLVLAVPGVRSEEPSKGFFNGKDLDGWEGLIRNTGASRTAPSSARPRRRASKFNTFLCSKKKYKDFELKFQVKLTKDGTGNSGVQIRSEIHDTKNIRRHRAAVRHGRGRTGAASTASTSAA